MQQEAQPSVVKSLVTLILLPLAVALTTGVEAVEALVAHKIWLWYPPFGVKAPSVPELYVLLMLLSFARPVDAPSRAKFSLADTIATTLLRAALTLVSTWLIHLVYS
jgi:hypothetical protein